MNDDNILLENFPQDKPFDLFRKVYQKFSKTEFHTIHFYYEFGLALTIHLNKLIKNRQKRA